MREQSKDPWRIKHILDCIDRIQRYTAELSFQEFVDDDRTYYAVVKNIEIIGEAANMLTIELRERNADIPWKAICGMRNYIVHEYFAVDAEVVWNVVSEDIPRLKESLSKLK